MKLLLALMMLLFTFKVFAQPTYTYVDPNPAIEKEKKDKEALFQKRKDDAFLRLQNCTKKCGSYAADANNPKDPCTLPGATPACICACNRKYDDSIRVVEQQEKTWQANIAKREEDYKNKKIKEQQQTNLNNNVQQQTTSQQQSNQNSLSTINDAITTTGNAIWDMIQSGRARKENTGKAIVTSFAQDLYERKKTIKYYDDVVCDKCNGSGTLIYNDNPNSIIYGQSHPCEQCNGIGRINKLKPQYALTFGNTHSQVSMNFGLYLLKAISNNVPLCKLNPSGYKGSIEMKVKASVGGHYDDLILIVTTTFNFLDRKGKFDADGYTYNSVDDKRVFPLNTIKSFEYIPSKTESVEGTTFQYSSHLILNTTTGETFEFTTDNEPSTVVDKLNNLLNTAKKSSIATSSNESGNKPSQLEQLLSNNESTANSGSEEIIAYLNNKVNCCRIQGYSFYENYDIDYDKFISSKFSPNKGFRTLPDTYKIASRGFGVIILSEEDDAGKKFEYYFHLQFCPDCIQYYQSRVYLIQSTEGTNGIEYGKIFRLLFKDSESATDFFNALKRLVK